MGSVSRLVRGGEGLAAAARGEDVVEPDGLVGAVARGERWGAGGGRGGTVFFTGCPL